jgi:hypothetical protein
VPRGSGECLTSAQTCPQLVPSKPAIEHHDHQSLNRNISQVYKWAKTGATAWTCPVCLILDQFDPESGASSFSVKTKVQQACPIVFISCLVQMHSVVAGSGPIAPAAIYATYNIETHDPEYNRPAIVFAITPAGGRSRSFFS